jgi:hypothetical protein
VNTVRLGLQKQAWTCWASDIRPRTLGHQRGRRQLGQPTSSTDRVQRRHVRRASCATAFPTVSSDTTELRLAAHGLAKPSPCGWPTPTCT